MWLRCVFGLSLRAAMSSIIRRRSGLTVLVSLMGSSILSEVDNTSISGRGSQTRQRCPLSWLPVSRLLPPRSGLERSDFVLWHIATFCCAVEFGRHRGIADIEQAAPAKPELRLRALVNCPTRLGKDGGHIR